MIDYLPAVGELCVTVRASDSETEFLFVFRDGLDPYHYRAIARITEFVGTPNCTGFVYTNLAVARVEGTQQFPVVEHTHLCRWDELQALKKLWQKKEEGSGRFCQSFEEWVAALQHDPSIPKNISDRLSRLL